MKKVLLVLFALLLVGSVFGGNKIKVDLNLEKTLLVPVLEKDMIEFYIDDIRNVIIIDKIGKDFMDLDIFLFADGDQKLSYISVVPNRTIKLDLDKDGKGEVYLSDGGKFGDKKLLLFYTPESENVLGDITGSTVTENADETGVNWYFIGLVIVLIGVLAIILVYLNIKKR